MLEHPASWGWLLASYIRRQKLMRRRWNSIFMVVVTLQAFVSGSFNGCWVYIFVCRKYAQLSQGMNFSKQYKWLYQKVMYLVCSKLCVLLPYAHSGIYVRILFEEYSGGGFLCGHLMLRYVRASWLLCHDIICN